MQDTPVISATRRASSAMLPTFSMARSIGSMPKNGAKLCKASQATLPISAQGDSRKLVSMSIGERIRSARLHRGLTQQGLADRVGVSREAVRQWENDKVEPANRRLQIIAQKLDVKKAYLVGDEQYKSRQLENENELSHQPLTGCVPLISWVQAGKWSEVVDNLHPGEAEDWIPTSKNVGKNAFALRVMGDSMEPRFPAGAIVVVDPDKEAVSGSLVVAKMGESATFKRLLKDAGRIWLRPENQQYPAMEVDKEVQIIGVVRQVIFDID